MRPTYKDAAAAVLVAAILVPFVGYLVRGSMPFIQDPTGMAGVVLILGLVAGAIGGWVGIRTGTLTLRITTIAAGIVSAGVAVTALVTEPALATTTRHWLLGGAVALVVALFGLATARHEGLIHSGPLGPE